MQADDYLLKLSHTPFKVKENLPNYPGIYYVVDDNSNQVLYIGQSVNINSRWKGRGHHRDYQLTKWTGSKQTSLTIYYEHIKVEFLDAIEKERITKYEPLFNDSTVTKKETISGEYLLIKTLEVLKEAGNLLILGIEQPRKDICQTLESLNTRLNLTKASILELPIVHLITIPDDHNIKYKLLLPFFNKNSYSEYNRQWTKISSYNLDTISPYNYNRYAICYRLIVHGYVIEVSEWKYWQDVIKNRLKYEDFIKTIKTLPTTFAGVTLQSLSQDSFDLLHLDKNKTYDPVYYLLSRITPYKQETITLSQLPEKLISDNQINKEIRDILKKINKNTTHFPFLRSLVLGEYLDSETRCILVAVDHCEERIFYNSMRKVIKSWSRDTMLYEFERKQYQSTVYKYKTADYTFEFITFEQIIDYMCLNDKLKTINTISILGAEIKALSSLEFIDFILIEAPDKPNQFNTNYWFTRSKILESGSYVFYLRPKLKPLQGSTLTITTTSKLTQNINNST